MVFLHRLDTLVEQEVDGLLVKSKYIVFILKTPAIITNILESQT